MLTITVNGQKRQVASAPDTPLLYVLRNELGIMSPKFGCGLAQCGACSVLLDGAEIRSCITPVVVAAAAKEITTVEGLPARWAKQRRRAVKDVSLHPVQEAWIEQQVPQCGFCQFGMMIKATELLEHNPKPSDEDIKAAFTDVRTLGSPVPVRQLRGDHRRRQARGVVDGEEGRLRMSDSTFQDATVYGAALTRRGFLKTGGALVVTPLSRRVTRSRRPASSNSLDPTRLSSWIEIRSDNTVQFRTGKCDFGQSSIYIAYPQIIAEELGMPLEAITDVISGDTDRTPDGGGTFGLLRTNVVNLRKVAAYTREAILELAAQRFGVPREQLTAKDGVVSAGGQSLTYGRLVHGQDLKLVIPVRGNPTDFSGLVGRGQSPAQARVGVHHRRQAVEESEHRGQGHGKDALGDRRDVARHVARPGHPSAHAGFDAREGGHASTPGNSATARVIVQGNFLGVVAPSEWDAIQAAQEVAASTAMDVLERPAGAREAVRSPAAEGDWAHLPVMTGAANKGDVAAALGGAAKVTLRKLRDSLPEARSDRPVRGTRRVRGDGTVTVHTSTQNPQFLRKGIATMLNLPIDKVVIRTYAGSGHYGRSNGGNAGPEDQAVLLAKAVGRPVRLQWMRAEDVQWSTQSSAMYSTIRIGLDANGRVARLPERPLRAADAGRSPARRSARGTADDGRPRPEGAGTPPG